MRGAGKDYVWAYKKPSLFRRLWRRVRWFWKTRKDPVLRRASVWLDTNDVELRSGRQVLPDQTGKGNDAFFGSKPGTPFFEGMIESVWVNGERRYPPLEDGELPLAIQIEDFLCVPHHPDLPIDFDEVYVPKPEHKFEAVPPDPKDWDVYLRVVERDGTFTLEQLKRGELVAAVDLPNEPAVLSFHNFGVYSKLELDWNPYGDDRNWSLARKDSGP